MTTIKVTFATVLILFLAEAKVQGQTVHMALQKPLSLFFEMKFNEALPLFEQIANDHQDNAEAQTWLAETYRRLGRKEDALRTAQHALVLEGCSSFAHVVFAQASYSDNETIGLHLRKAIECDPTDPNGWLMMWGEAIRHADPALKNTCLRKLVETGFFTRAAFAYGRAELRTLPPNALFITNGDMDTYPAQAVQITENFRTDVAVVEREHFGIGWACRFIRDHQGVPLPVPDEELDSMKDTADASGKTVTASEQMFRMLLDEKARGMFTRPIALAPTLGRDFYSRDEDHFQDHGMFLLWNGERRGTAVDTSDLRRCLEGINPDDFTGPWASVKDRSPVRRYYTNGIVRVLYAIALRYSEEMIRANRSHEADSTLNWLEQFETKTEFGPDSTSEIARLRAKINSLQ